MSSLLTQCLLLPTFCKTRLYALREESKVERAFYHHDAFRKSDLALKKAYQGLNPYTLSRQFLLQKGEKDIHLYGETPLTTLYAIACRFGISSKDHLFDLGSGRGRGLNFFRHYVGCQVTGIEWHPIFVEKSPQDEKIKVLCTHFLDIDFSEASVIYFYGTSFSDELIEKLACKFASLPDSVRIITVSYPLRDYHPSFVVESSFTGSFPWGKTEIFLNRKKEELISLKRPS